MPAQTVQICLKNGDVLPAMSQDHTSVSLWVTLGWTPSFWSCAWLGPAHPPHTKAAPQVPIMQRHNLGQVLFENTNLQFSPTSKPESGSK